MNKTCFLHLNAFPGTGKLTIAKEICRQDNFRLIDNHATANLIFTMARKDGKSPIPSQAWEAVLEIREVVMRYLPKIALPNLNFVFTHCLFEDNEDERAVQEQVMDTANKHGSVFIPVNLICDLKENQRRIISPDREENKKMTDPEGLEEIHQHNLLKSNSPHFMELNVTHLQAKDSAQKIYEHILKIIN